MPRRVDWAMFLSAGLDKPAPGRLAHRRVHRTPRLLSLANRVHASDVGGRQLAPEAQRRVRYQDGRVRYPGPSTVTGRSELFKGIVGDSLSHVLDRLAGKRTHFIVFHIPAQGSGHCAS